MKDHLWKLLDLCKEVVENSLDVFVLGNQLAGCSMSIAGAVFCATPNPC